MSEKMHQPDDMVLEKVQEIMTMYFASETKDVSDWAYGPAFVVLYEILFEDQYFHPKSETRHALRRLNKGGWIEYPNSVMR